MENNEYKDLNIAELLFQSGVAKMEFKKAYAKDKAIDEEILRRAKSKIDMSIATGGRRGVAESLEFEMEEIDVKNS